MKLEVGMYVRTKRDGIGKIISLSIGEEDECCFIELSKRRTGIKEHNIVKEPSHNIIDLIEVGDVIVDEVGNKYPINYEFETDYNNEYGSYEITIDDYITLFFKDGLSIVTKEQFEAMQYEIK